MVDQGQAAGDTTEAEEAVWGVSCSRHFSGYCRTCRRGDNGN